MQLLLSEEVPLQNNPAQLCSGCLSSLHTAVESTILIAGGAAVHKAGGGLCPRGDALGSRRSPQLCVISVQNRCAK